MMNRKYGLLIFVLLLIALMFGFWKGASVLYFAAPTSAPAGNDQLPSAAAAANSAQSVPKRVGTAKQLSSDPKTLFIDESSNRAARFAALSQLARAGNADAKYFQAQMAMDCEVATRANSDPTVLSNAKPQNRPQIARALQIMGTGCYALLQTPDYVEFKAGGEVNRDTYEGDVVTRMKEAFANSGADALGKETLAVLSSRPDETTVAAIIDTYADMGLLSSLTGDKGGMSYTPERREQLMYALNLLTCDYGRDCGPNSAVVAMYCASLGACTPGADLSQLFASNLLSGLDYQKVTDLRDHLRGLQKH